MKKPVYLSLLCCLTLIPCHAAVTKKTKPNTQPKKNIPIEKPAVAPKPFVGLPFSVQNTSDFFRDFTSKAETNQRDEFETEEQFKKRVPPWDHDKVLYFKVEPNLVGNGKNIIDCNYKYDFGHTSLNLSAGSYCPDDGEYNPEDTQKACILDTVEDQGTYEASNAFNAHFTVQKSLETEYVFFLSNIDRFNPDDFNIDTYQFSFDRLLSPNEARDLSKNAQIYIAVQPYDYSKSSFECVSRMKPTIDKPREINIFRYGIKAKLLKIILWDNAAHKVLDEHTPTQQ